MRRSFSPSIFTLSLFMASPPRGWRGRVGHDSPSWWKEWRRGVTLTKLPDKTVRKNVELLTAAHDQHGTTAAKRRITRSQPMTFSTLSSFSRIEAMRVLASALVPRRAAALNGAAGGARA